MIGIAESTKDFFGHFCADTIVTIESKSLRFIVPGLCGRLGDVVKEDGQGEMQGGGVEKRERNPRVDVDVAFRMPLRRLLATLQGEEFGKEGFGESGFSKEVQTTAPVFGYEDF